MPEHVPSLELQWRQNSRNSVLNYHILLRARRSETLSGCAE